MYFFSSILTQRDGSNGMVRSSWFRSKTQNHYILNRQGPNFSVPSFNIGKPYILIQFWTWEYCKSRHFDLVLNLGILQIPSFWFGIEPGNIAVLWVSELILWVSELIPLYFGCLNLYFGCMNLYFTGFTSCFMHRGVEVRNPHTSMKGCGSRPECSSLSQILTPRRGGFIWFSNKMPSASAQRFK